MSMSRRGLFGFLGLAAGASAVPLAAGAVALLDPGRRVTHLPGGGTLIEDETFRTGIKLENCQGMTIRGCTISGFDTGFEMKLPPHDARIAYAEYLGSNPVGVGPEPSIG